MTTTETKTKTIYDVVEKKLENSLSNGFEVMSNFILYTVLTSDDKKLRAIAENYVAKLRERMTNPAIIEDIVSSSGQNDLACAMMLLGKKQVTQ